MDVSAAPILISCLAHRIQQPILNPLWIRIFTIFFRQFRVSFTSLVCLLVIFCPKTIVVEVQETKFWNWLSDQVSKILVYLNPQTKDTQWSLFIEIQNFWAWADQLGRYIWPDIFLSFFTVWTKKCYNQMLKFFDHFLRDCYIHS